MSKDSSMHKVIRPLQKSGAPSKPYPNPEDVLDLDEEIRKRQAQAQKRQCTSTSSSSSSSSSQVHSSGLLRASSQSFAEISENEDPTEPALESRRRKALRNLNGIDAFNVPERHPVRGSEGPSSEDSEMAISHRNLKTAALFGKPFVPAGQEEKGTEIALRATLTGFSDIMQSSLALEKLSETDVKTVLTRFPALEGRDLAKQKHELHFEEFAHSYKSKEPWVRELAGGLHAVLAGQEILRVSLSIFPLLMHAIINSLQMYTTISTCPHCNKNEYNMYTRFVCPHVLFVYRHEPRCTCLKLWINFVATNWNWVTLVLRGSYKHQN